MESKEDLLSNKVKIVDFGLATRMDVDEYLFKRCGTPGFVAPEIIKSSTDDDSKFCSKVDVFSAGVICYILLTGKNPFKGDDFKAILKANRDCKIDFKSGDLADKDPQIIEVLQLMMEKNPANRVTASEALAHPFFNKENISLDNLDTLDETEG